MRRWIVGHYKQVSNVIAKVVSGSRGRLDGRTTGAVVRGRGGRRRRRRFAVKAFGVLVKGRGRVGGGRGPPVLDRQRSAAAPQRNVFAAFVSRGVVLDVQAGAGPQRPVHEQPGAQAVERAAYLHGTAAAHARLLLPFVGRRRRRPRPGYHHVAAVQSVQAPLGRTAGADRWGDRLFDAVHAKFCKNHNVVR